MDGQRGQTVMAPFLPVAIMFVGAVALASAWRLSLGAALFVGTLAGGVVALAMALALPDSDMLADMSPANVTAGYQKPGKS